MLRALLALLLLLPASGLEAAGYQARARVSTPAPALIVPALDAPRVVELENLLLVPPVVHGAPPAQPGQYRVFQRDLFDALVLKDAAKAAALRDQITSGQLPLRKLKGAMYDSFFALYDNGLMDPVRREQNAALLAEKYAQFFDGLAADPKARRTLQARAEEASAWVSDPRTIMWPLTETRQAFHAYKVAELWFAHLTQPPPLPAAAEAAPAEAAPAAPAVPAAQLVPPWPRPERRGRHERGQGVDRPVAAAQLGMREIQDKAKAISFELEKRATRAYIAQTKGFSARIVAMTMGELQKVVEKAQGELLNMVQDIRRHSIYRVAGAFVQLGERRRSILHVPTHPGLALSRVVGGYRIDAKFKTDIDDPETIASIKEMIEDYWSGSFKLDGSFYNLRTRVTIEPLKPGEEWPATHLRLVDGKDGFPLAGSWGIQLGRAPNYFYYGIAAHEFGHVLGLADEYWDDFDPETGLGFAVERPASMMSASRGEILPRHKRLAVQLLRRRRYAGWKFF